MRQSHIDWYWWRLIQLYSFFSPLVVLRIPNSGAFGASDFLFVPAAALFLLQRRRVLPGFTIFYLFFIVWAALSSIVQSDPDLTLRSFILAVRALSIYLPFLMVFQIREFSQFEFNRVVWAFILGGGLAIVIGLLSYELGVEIREGQQRIWFDGEFGSGALRAAGLLGSTGGFGHLISLWGLSVIVVASATRLRWKEWLLPIGLIVLVYALFASASRAALMHLIIGLIIGAPVIFGQFAGRRSLFRVLGTIVLLLISISTIFWILVGRAELPVVLRRFDFLGITGESAFFQSVRFSNWRAILEDVEQNPIFGAGYKLYYEKTGIFVDNAFISTIVETGLIGGILYLMFWIYLIRIFLRYYLRGSIYGMAGLSLVVSDAAHALTLDIYSIWFSMPVSFILMGGLLRLSKSELIYERRVRISQIGTRTWLRQTGSTWSRFSR